MIVRPRITRGSIVSGPALFNYVSQTNAPPRRAQLANDAVVLAGKRAVFYGITRDYRKDKRPFKEDLSKLLELLRQQRLQPRIAARLPLLDGKRAEEMLEAGGVAGKIVLVA